MSFLIRHERKEDYKLVEEITREAFWNLYFPGCNEHYLVHKIRQHEDYLPQLSFVIEVDGQVIGSIYYTKSSIVMNDKVIDTVTFGPVSIHPDYHRKGFGRKLIEYSIEQSRNQGCRAILILGYPYHYEPYGFKGSKAFNITMSDGLFYKGFMALPLYEGALDGLHGYVSFSDVFEDPDEETLEAFDKDFPKKEKTYKPSQDEFKVASAMLDE